MKTTNIFFKAITMALVFTTSLAFTGCGSDDNSGNEGTTGDYSEMIIGVWETKQISFDNQNWSSTDEGCGFPFSEFKSNGTLVSIFKSGASCTEEITNSTWSISGSTLTVINNFGETPNEILQLNNSTMKIKYEMSASMTIYYIFEKL